MLPFIHLKLFGLSSLVPTNDLLLMLSMILSFGVLARVYGLRKSWKASILVISVTVAAFIGGRVLHVAWERPELLQNPKLIFSRWDGMVFYGGLASGLLAFWAVARVLERDRLLRMRLWDHGAIAVALSGGLLRLGCFASGCCWGKLSSAPWSVVYSDPRSVMPVLGIPVHPVQVYDSVLAFLIAGILVAFNQLIEARSLAWLRGLLFPMFGLLYSISRFATEYFRGDAIRKTDVLLGLSTSQIISALLFIVAGSVIFLGWTRAKNKLLQRPVRAKLAAGLLALISISGCVAPEPPSPEIFASQKAIRPGLEGYRSNPNRVHHVEGKPVRRGNALFLTADSYIYRSLETQARKAMGGDTLPALDDLVWWEYAPIFTTMYSRIIRITIEEAKYATLVDALNELESRGEPFDVYLLSHGMPNHLSSGEGYFLSYKELAKLKGHFKNLNLVFMQSCYGSSLTQDWHQAGAKYVISFDGLNRNFFWISFFLRWYRGHPIPESYSRTNGYIDFGIANEFLYVKILGALGLTPEQYLQIAKSPKLSAR